MKRFWTEVSVEQGRVGWTVHLDRRRVKTPARTILELPTAPLANAIAEEWRGVGETIDPRAMLLTGLANAAIDRVEPDPKAFATSLSQYAEADLTCYRAEQPRALVDRQAQIWDPLLAWARRSFDMDFAVTTGITHVSQPRATVERLSQAIAELDNFALAGLAPLITIGGSLVAALAVIEKALPAEEAWDAVSLDERWQLEQWGADAEAEAALDNRRRDFLAAARFVDLA